MTAGPLPDPAPEAVRAAHLDDLIAVLPAVPSALAGARALVRDWLAAHAWPIPAAEDIVLAVNEALTNVVDHAYPPAAPGAAHLHAWISVEPRTRTRRVIAAVTDHGRWAAHHPDDQAAHTRGRGLILMNRCTAEMHLQRSAGGTTVILISPAIGPLTL